MTENSGRKKRSSGQKVLPNYFTRWKLMLEALALGEIPQRIRETMTRQYGVSKSLFSQDIKEMIGEGWIIDDNPLMNKNKAYKVTESGHTVLLAWENTEKKTLTKIENARHVCKIRNTKLLDSFLSTEVYGFERHKFNNVKFFSGKVTMKNTAMSVGVYIGNEVTLLITPAPMYARDLVTGHHKIHQTMLDWCNDVNKKWLFELTIPEPTSHRQYTISDQFAEDMLKLSGGSQLKFETSSGAKASIDMSPRGKEKRFELDTLEIAQKYSDTPDLVRLLLTKVNENSEIITNVVKSSITLAENINKISEQLSQLISVQVKTGQESGQKPNELNSMSSMMFK